VEILHTVYKEISTDFNLNFEHEIDSDGGSGDSGGIFSYLFWINVWRDKLQLTHIAR
jgi:hypothetical protein